MYMGEYLAILLLLPLAIIYFSEGNRRISNAGIFFNIVFLAIPTYLLLNEIIQGTDYHLGLALTFFGIIAIAPISNIIVLYPYKKPNDQSQ